MRLHRTVVAAITFVGLLSGTGRATYADDDMFETLSLAQLYDKVVTSIVLVTQGIDNVKGFGSGVVIHKDGYIVSAAHVVERADHIGIQFKNGQKTEAKIVTLSEHQDLVLLKVDAIPDGIEVAKLGDSTRVRPGNRVFCIGAPRGLRFSVSAGIVSGIGRHLGDRYTLHSPDQLIQTDAAVNPGNSGGALFNQAGEVVGIAVKIITDGTGANSAGLGLAVPSEIVYDRLFVHSLPYLGMYLQRISPRLAQVMNWPPYEALLVEGVRAGSNAEKAGFRKGEYAGKVASINLILGGDLIYEIGGIPVAQDKKVHEYLHSLKFGDKIKYSIWREGKPFTIEVDVEAAAPIPQIESPFEKDADMPPPPSETEAPVKDN